jgi:hypothetical protein
MAAHLVHVRTEEPASTMSPDGHSGPADGGGAVAAPSASRPGVRPAAEVSIPPDGSRGRRVDLVQAAETETGTDAADADAVEAAVRSARRRKDQPGPRST